MDDILSKYALMTSFLGNTLGTSCEVYLLDAREKSLPVVAQHNLHRGTLGPLRRLVREVLKNDIIVENGVLLNRGLTSDTEKMFKASLYFIKDGTGTPVGVLCLVIRMNMYMELYGCLESMIRFGTEDLDEIRPGNLGVETPEKPTLELIDRMTAAFTADPQRMTPDERTELLLDLYETGVFDLKGAVARAAAALQMSEQSVYRYLSKIKRDRD